jgi:hypothetical protein
VGYNLIIYKDLNTEYFQASTIKEDLISSITLNIIIRIGYIVEMRLEITLLMIMRIAFHQRQIYL